MEAQQQSSEQEENCKKEENCFLQPFNRPVSAWVKGAVFLCPDGTFIEYNPDKK